MATQKGWLGSARLVAFCTLFSRVLGLVRDVAMAAFVGAGATMDAFVLAFMVPNLFRRLFGEGAMSAAFVPVFSEHWERDGPEGAGRFFRACFTALMAFLAAITGLVWLLSVLAPRYIALNETWALFFPLLSVLFPYMPMICLAALAGAALNVRGHFFGPAFAPAMLNVFWILGLVASVRYGIWAVAFAVLAGGAAQLLIVLFLLPSRGVAPGLEWAPEHEGVRRTARLLAPALAGLAVMQVNVLFDGLIAQFCVPGDGANSALYYGNRLLQFPLGVIGVALTTAIFPTMARAAARGEDGELLGTVRQGLRVACFLMLPVAALTLALALPIVELIYERGRFGEEAALRAAWVLSLYGLGLPAYSGTQIVVRAFYSRKDTRTPVRVGVAMVGLNLALNLTLVWPLREAGLALATAVSAFVNGGVLLWILRRRMGPLGMGEVAKSALRSGAMGLAGGGAAWLLLRVAGEGQLARVAVPMVAGGALYATAAVLLRVPEWGETVGGMRRRKGGG